MQQYDLAIFIGRFQPYHNGHQQATQRGLEIADRVLFILGSADAPRTIKNPFTATEREVFIRNAHRPAEPGVSDGLYFEEVADTPFDDQWIAAVQTAVNKHVRQHGGSKICLIGHDKDASSFYLKCFPQWKFIDTGFECSTKLDATQIRHFFFNEQMEYLVGALHPEVINSINFVKRHVLKEEGFKALVDEYKYYDQYKKAWLAAPYAPTFVTCDACVIQSGHVLVVERGENPGKGLLALPGGFLNPGERLADGAIRELIEETEIKLQPEVLKRCIVESHVFDEPGRSLRGRTITHAFLFKLDDAKPLPKVRGADDAAKARWLPFSEIKPMSFFEDHYFIIKALAKL